MKSRSMFSISVLLIVMTCNIFGQASESGFNILPASPETNALFRFIDYPMDNSTGLPNISIPLYEIKCGELSVPISLGYHSSGRRVTENTGPIGLGWSLFAGGTVSRTIYGKADESYTFPSAFKAAEDITYDDYEYLHNIFDLSQFDTEYDVFSYYFGTKSGKFVMSENTPVLMPEKPFDISWSSYGTVITDDKGIEYNFETIESLSGSGRPTAWYLTHMISSNKTDTINFSYTQRTFTSHSKVEQQVLNAYGTGTYRPDEPYGETQGVYDGFVYSVQRLTGISSRNCSVTFHLDQYSCIDKITINDKTNTIKVIDLYNSRFVDPYTLQEQFNAYTNEYDRKLDSLAINDSDEIHIEKYLFDYYQSYPIGYFCNDYWGFLNKTDQTLGIPREQVDTESGSVWIGDASTDKTPYLSYTKAGVLKKITYPTGGTTEFVYESNQSKPAQTVINCGGLRVYQIKTKAINGLEMIKTYKYGSNEDGAGTLPYWASSNSTAIERLYFEIDSIGTRSYGRVLFCEGSYKQRVYSSDFLPEIAYIADIPISYSIVTEYLGTKSDNTGKIVYYYETIPVGGDYTHINTLSTPTAGLYISPYPFIAGKGDAENESNYYYYGDGDISRHYVKVLNLWDYVPLTSKQEYIRSGTSYTQVRSTTYVYKDIIGDTLIGLRIWKYIDIPPEWNSEDKAEIEEIIFHDAEDPLYQFATYYIINGKKELEKTITSNYTSNGEITDSTRFYYNSYDLVSQKREYLNYNKVKITDFKYPFDYPFDTLALYNSMESRNMLDYPLKVSISVSDDPISEQSTVYKSWGGYLILPERKVTLYGNSTDSISIGYNLYNSHGNLLEVQKANDIKVSFLWGYKNTLPIAEIINSPSSDVFFTSFEEIDGNTSDSFSGELARSNGFTKQLEDLNNGIYILSFRHKSGNSWLLNTDTISVSSNTYTINISGQVDDVRFHPLNAQMTTYTYKPLVGITSKTDPNNITTFYEYDSFGRLEYIRDNDRKILRHIKYHYTSENGN